MMHIIAGAVVALLSHAVTDLINQILRPRRGE